MRTLHVSLWLICELSLLATGETPSMYCLAVHQANIPPASPATVSFKKYGSFSILVLISPDNSSSTSHAAHTNLPCKNRASFVLSHTAKSPQSWSIHHIERVSRQHSAARTNDETEARKEGQSLTIVKPILRNPQLGPIITVYHPRMEAHNLHVLRLHLLRKQLEIERPHRFRERVGGPHGNARVCGRVNRLRGSVDDDLYQNINQQSSIQPTSE